MRNAAGFVFAGASGQCARFQEAALPVPSGRWSLSDSGPSHSSHTYLLGDAELVS